MRKINITSSGTYNITENMGSDIALSTSGTVNLSSDLTIAYSSTPYEGLKLNIYALMSLGTTSNVRNVTILGKGYQHILFTSANAVEITAIYLNSAWNVFSKASTLVNENRLQLSDAKAYTISEGNVIELSREKNRQRFVLNGTLSIGTDATITYTGTPAEGTQYEFYYNSIVTYTNRGCAVEVLGRALTQTEALSGELYITALYTTSNGWEVRVLTGIENTSQEFSVTLTAAEIDKLNSTPVEIISGISNKIIAIENIFGYKNGTTAYTTNVTLELFNTKTTKTIFDNAQILASISNGAIYTFDKKAVSSSIDAVSGSGISVRVKTGEVAGESSDTVTLFGTYRYLTV